MKNPLHAIARCAAIAWCGCAIAAAQAAPVTLTGGESMLFNVDIAGLGPGAPFDVVTFISGLDASASSGSSHITFFSELDGGGSALVDPFTSISDLIAFGLTDGVFTDGVFSVLAAVEPGGQLTLAPSVIGRVDTIRGSFVTDQVFLDGQAVQDDTGGNPVPEPTSGLLVLLGLGCLVAARGRGEPRPPRAVAASNPN